MKRASWGRILAGLGVALALTGCGFDEEAVKTMAKEKGLSELETAAFLVCAKESRRNKPIFPIAENNMVLNEMPLEICACQSKAMVGVYLDNTYGSYASFATYMAAEKKKKSAKWKKKELRQGVKPADAQAKLTNSLLACVKDYESSHAEQAAGLYEMVPIPVKPEKKKAEQPKDGTSS